MNWDTPIRNIIYANNILKSNLIGNWRKENGLARIVKNEAIVKNTTKQLK